MPTAGPVILTKAAHALIPRINDGVKCVRAGIMGGTSRLGGSTASESLREGDPWAIQSTGSAGGWGSGPETEPPF